ncbi:hypothetical protein GLOIN_2v1544050 [Rhizophagus irregularis DAOM 181602=DAOM 197198]|uniref:Uncharacterized protein n=1 Tax=Rhizophagus irregularis (strain DAOM 181602 / DAOM 197198 / MUCL 43194) TaxID=747089 RepID=A0A2P4QJN0_RHIID|nr:hypothetical protein GLOIN_2v1544050 [Rhizophagus irregularis DAOM 181602=DAOM 197198]POG77844.1 hypothetical protein GLOIN_2v1544050 [Rhizophagus irregularis DAOM 181602=DAOM 197198]GET55522.1 hypothetical protein GLOIN_2v1544050 [Rhizophagus irregularis DAOM 181602=DAOM 197198]|eukprot:XP_025184710.1 hypothetical protein GLOIN_2v1544050 [Rhizophagus irregularis DAOM 181602=DAOM 197198]
MTTSKKPLLQFNLRSKYITNFGEYGLRFKNPEDHTNQKDQWQNVYFYGKTPISLLLLFFSANLFSLFFSAIKKSNIIVVSLKGFIYI